MGFIYLAVYRYSRIAGNPSLIKAAVAFWAYGLFFLAYQNPYFQAASRFLLGAQVVAALFIVYYSVLFVRLLFMR